jgi:hypothetical protein
MKHKPFFALLFVFALAITGCKKDDGGTTPTPTPTQPSTPTPPSYNGQTPTNVLAVVRVSSVQTTPIGNVTIDVNAATAVFGNPGTDKGTVTLASGSSNITLGKLTSNNVVSYIFPDPSNPTSVLTLSANAVPVTFTVQNYALSPNGTVTLPGQVTLTAPAANVTIARNADYTVTWTVSGGAGTRHAIFIADAAGHSVFKDGVSNGSGSFTAAELGGLSAGTGWVYALTYNFSLVNSNQAVIVGEAVAINSVTLQ